VSGDIALIVKPRKLVISAGNRRSQRQLDDFSIRFACLRLRYRRLQRFTILPHRSRVIRSVASSVFSVCHEPA